MSVIVPRADVMIERNDGPKKRTWDPREPRSLGQQRPRLPQFGKEFLVQGELQIRRARASAGSHADPDNALDELNVAQSPAHNQFIELRKPFAHVDPVAIMMLVLIKRVHRMCARIKLLPLSAVD